MDQSSFSSSQLGHIAHIATCKVRGAFFLYNLIYLFYWIFIVSEGAFSSCEQRLLFVSVCGLLVVVASFVAECGL